MPVLILAAGASARMGGTDKLLQEVDGDPLIRRQVKMALGFSDQIYVALPPRPHGRYDALHDLDVHLVEVAATAEGMGASLRTGFAALPDGTPHAMLLLADLPDITTDDLCQTADAVAKFPDNLIWRGATQDGAPGHPIIFDHSLFPEIARLHGDTGAHSIAQAIGDEVHMVPMPGNRARLDLDTPADWADWRERRTKP